MTNEKAICPICGNEFIKKQKNSRCCSHSCNQAFWRNTHKKVYEKICPICVRGFETTNSRGKYCGELCRARAHSMRSLQYAKKEQHPPRQCRECGEEFIPKTKLSNFCSAECKRIYCAKSRAKAFKPKECAICGKEFMPKSSSAKYCSDECRKESIRRALKSARMGRDNPSVCYADTSRPASFAMRGRGTDLADSKKQPLSRQSRQLPLHRGAKAVEGLKQGRLLVEGDQGGLKGGNSALRTPHSALTKRWEKMSWKEISAECARFHLTYGQAQVMLANGTLPEDFGLRKN